MKDIENSKKEAPLKESPMLGLTGMGGGVASLMWHHAAGLVQGGLWVWGNNTYGEMMKNYSQGAKRSSPVQVGTDTTWAHLLDCGTADGYNSFAGKADGTLWVSGSPKEDGNGGNVGMTGLNNDVLYSSPVQIPGVTWSGSFAKASRTVIATKTDGTLWVWGKNTYGMLGLNEKAPTRPSVSSPTQIPGSWKIEKGGVSGGNEYLFGIKQDGTLWVWGKNDNNGFGMSQPSNYFRSSPVQVGTDNNWASINAGGGYSTQIAIKTDGTMWSWGNNGSGQLGLNNQTPANSPTQIPGTTWVATSNGSSGVHATKSDGTMWGWGSNSHGQLGFSNKSDYSSPKQLPGTNWKTDFQGFGTIGVAAAAVKTDGTLWTWGTNEVGQLGLNQSAGDGSANYSSPKQVPGTNWLAVGGFTSMTAKAFAALRK